MHLSFIALTHYPHHFLALSFPALNAHVIFQFISVLSVKQATASGFRDAVLTCVYVCTRVPACYVLCQIR